MKSNMKKIASVLLAAVMLLGICALLPASAAEADQPVGAGLTVSGTSNFFAAQTKSFTTSDKDLFVTVEYKLCAKDMYLINIDIDSLTYDPAVLEWKEEYNTIQVGRNTILDFFPFAAENSFGQGSVNQTEAGKIIGNFSSVKPAAYADNEDGSAVTAVKATFKVLNKAAGSTEVRCTVDTLSLCDANERFPYMKYIAIDKKTVNAENKAKATYSTDITFSEGEATELLGDVDNNGVVNINDATLLQRYLAEYTVTLNLKLADTNRDGKVDIRDITEIQRYVAQIITAF